jgi:hypothetical protein
MEKSIAKTDTKEKGQRDWWLTNPSQQPKPQSLLRDITTQKWLITPSNLPTIIQTNSKIQTPDRI